MRSKDEISQGITNVLERDEGAARIDVAAMVLIEVLVDIRDLLALGPSHVSCTQGDRENPDPPPEHLRPDPPPPAPEPGRPAALPCGHPLPDRG